MPKPYKPPEELWKNQTTTCYCRNWVKELIYTLAKKFKIGQTKLMDVMFDGMTEDEFKLKHERYQEKRKGENKDA